MRIFITGAKGFIGSHLFGSLQDLGHAVRGIDNYSHPSQSPLVIEYGDVRYYNDIDHHVAWSDVVFHLAAQIHVDKSINNPEETLDTNVKGTLNILEACRKHKKRLIFASSSEVYGTSQTGLMSEKHPLDPQSPYAASKVAADRLCHSYHITYGLPVTILRNFNTFGPFQNDGREGASYGAVIGIFTSLALADKPLTVFGTGEQERDYMYITEAVTAYQFCLDHPELAGHELNVGSGTTITINELARMIIDITGSSSEIVHVDPRPGEVQKLQADMTKANSLGLFCSSSFKKNVTQYIEWYRQFYGL